MIQLKTKKAAKLVCLFRNDVGIDYNPDTTHYELDKNAETVIGENEYKIPLRLLITQIKDSQGNIKQCYVKYLIPETMTFGDPVTVDREGYLYKATIDTLKGFQDFMYNSFKKAADDDNETRRNFRSGDWWRWDSDDNNDTAAGSEAHLRVQDQNLGIQNYVGTWRAAAINWMMGRRGGGDEYNNGILPVLCRSHKQKLPAVSSRGFSFATIEKIWSQAAQEEARQKTGHFKVDALPGDFDEFDRLFSFDMGRLLKKPNPNPPIISLKPQLQD